MNFNDLITMTKINFELNKNLIMDITEAMKYFENYLSNMRCEANLLFNKKISNKFCSLTNDFIEEMKKEGKISFGGYGEEVYGRSNCFITIDAPKKEKIIRDHKKLQEEIEIFLKR